MQLPHFSALARRALAGSLTLGLLAHSAPATWSIVAVNTRTGEVCVASATCLESFDLEQYLPVVRVGVGGGCAQSYVDSTGANRLIMWNGFINGLSPTQILAQMALSPQHYTKQYGVVDMLHDPITFTGTGCGHDAAGGAGVFGEIRYAIQGNVIVGGTLVQLAEQALLATPGDLTTKVMAAMEAARAIGGDGRCSCNPNAPWSCNPLPPPVPFKSAHVGFIICARIGDLDGASCTATYGCATGQYYLDFNVIGNAQSVDPVLQMEQQYPLWRASWMGRPDHVLSRVSAGARSLVADGVSQTQVTVQLVDIEGVELSNGGAQLTLTNTSGAPSVSVPSAVVDNGDGTYSFTLQAGTATGEDRWRIVVHDGFGPVTLHPELALRVDPVQPVHLGRDSLSAALQQRLPIVVHARKAPGRPMLVLASTAGTTPGLPFAGAHLPLNPSYLLTFTYLNANSPQLQHTYSRLDRSGRAEALFAPDPALYGLLAGSHVDFTAVVFQPAAVFVLAPVGLDVLP